MWISALLSALLSYQTLQPAPNNDVAYAAAVPTFTATAWYHKKLPAELAGDLKKAVAEARAFTWGEYTQALTRGNTLSENFRATKDGVQSQGPTGCHLPLDFW